jgi:hypothetical protein
MIRNVFALAILAFLFGGCSQNGEKTSNVETEEEIAVETPMLAIGEFDAKAGDYVDNEILVEGIVDHVCKHGGKKLFLVADDGDVHIESDERFDDALEGSHVTVKGIVREFRVDEAYCLQMEEENMTNHSEGKSSDEQYKHKLSQIQYYRDSMKVAGVDHLSYYSIDFVSLEVKDQPDAL